MKSTCPNWDSGGWISSPAYISYTVSVLSDLLKLHSDSRILDIGCGRGNITRAFANQHSFELPIEAIDVSATVSEASGSKGVEFYQIDALSYLAEQPGHAYDAVILKQVFHCFESSDRAALLEELHRCLKPSGQVLIFVMPPEIGIPMFESGKKTYLLERLHHRDVTGICQEYGFNTSVHEFSYPVEIARQDYYNLLRQRFISNLRNLSDLEIEEGIEELDNENPDSVFRFDDELIIVELSRDKTE